MGVFVPEHKQCLEITIVPFLPAEQLGGEILSAGGSQVACSEGKMSQCVGDWDRKAELCSATGTREILPCSSPRGTNGHEPCGAGHGDLSAG